MNWKIVRSIIPIVVMIFFAYYTKNLKVDYTALEPVLKTNAHDILWRFQMNEGEELVYNVIQVNGKITDIDSNNFKLHYKIICTSYDSTFSLNRDKQVTIKGRCIKYDPITEELFLDNVVMIKD